MVSIKFCIAVILSAGLLACSEKQQEGYKLSDATNAEWTKGVAKFGTAFFVKNNSQTAMDFAVGKKVVLSDGGIRSVTAIQINGENLIVYLDGEKLNGDLVGYPRSVKPYNP